MLYGAIGWVSTADSVNRNESLASGINFYLSGCLIFHSNYWRICHGPIPGVSKQLLCDALSRADGGEIYVESIIIIPQNYWSILASLYNLYQCWLMLDACVCPSFNGLKDDLQHKLRTCQLYYALWATFFPTKNESKSLLILI